jgi:hypothetical protein
LDGQTATGPYYDPSYGTPKKNPGAAPDVFNDLEDYARLAAAGFKGTRIGENGQEQPYYWKEEHLQNIQEIVIQTVGNNAFTPQPPPPQPQP